MSRVFLSHSSKDKAFARRLGADLRRNGHVVWIDEAEIQVGDSLIEKIRDGIDEVDFVAAVLSKASIKSEWVKKELDLASNREIEERRVIVLPLLIQNVTPPGFLKGKKYADFRPGAPYKKSLQELLKRLGPAKPISASGQELTQLRAELAAAKATADTYSRDLNRHHKLVKLRRSRKLQNAIDEENEESPDYSTINNSYAFEIDGFPVTLGYVLWSLWKSQREGGPSPLELMIELHDRWDDVKLMLEAYGDYIGHKPRRKRPR